MKASLIVLLVVGNMASAATDWTTKPMTVRGKTGETCKLNIDTPIVVPKNADYSDVASKINELLGKNVLSTTEEYYSAVASLGAKCVKSRTTGGLSAELVTSLIYADENWSSWQQNYASYLGGAHGSTAAYRLVISPTGELVTFDTVLAVSREAFIQTIVSKLTALNRYNDGSFSFWAEQENNLKELNYYANSLGISIFFNSYVIASYAEGPTEISYTWEEMKSLLKANSIFSSKLK